MNVFNEFSFKKHGQLIRNALFDVKAMSEKRIGLIDNGEENRIFQ